MPPPRPIPLPGAQHPEVLTDPTGCRATELQDRRNAAAFIHDLWNSDLSDDSDIDMDEFLGTKEEEVVVDVLPTPPIPEQRSAISHEFSELFSFRSPEPRQPSRRHASVESFTSDDSDL
jgi:hypothetical protein